MYFTLYFINHSILCIWFLFFKNFSYFIKKVKWVYIKLWLMENKINKTKKKWDKEFLFLSKHNDMVLFSFKLIVANINEREREEGPYYHILRALINYFWSWRYVKVLCILSNNCNEIPRFRLLSTSSSLY